MEFKKDAGKTSYFSAEYVALFNQPKGIPKDGDPKPKPVSETPRNMPVTKPMLKPSAIDESEDGSGEST